MSLTWVNMPAVVAAKEGHIFDDGGTEVLSREFLRMLNDLSEDKLHSAAYWWAIEVGEDSLMKLQLQSLLGPAVLIAGSPLYNSK